MGKTYRRLLGMMLALLLAAMPVFALAASEKSVVSLGNNLTSKQKSDVLEMLGVDEDDDNISYVTVSIDEERALLGDYISADKIGSKSLSSAYVRIAAPGSGITVKTHHINWVTEAMYASALATAGVEDADIIVAAPFDVSGTAALTGIYKAYESAVDEHLKDEAKAVAADELVTTGELGESIGVEEAASLIAQVKQEIIKAGITDRASMRSYIEDLAEKSGISLSDDQLDKITDLAMKFMELDLDPDKLAAQIRNFESYLKKIGGAAQKIAEFFDAFGKAFKSFFDWIAGLFNGR